jgi:predicted phage terminase large subunit-like protein
MSSETEILKEKVENNEVVQELLRSPTLKKAVENPRLITRELNNRSLYHFLRWAWPELSGQPFVDNWHIKYLCDELEEVARRVGRRERKKHDLLINVPPGSTKTILCSIVFPVWCWTQWYWMRFITASYSSALSLESAEYCRDLVKSQKFKEIYPDIDIKSDKDTKGNFKIVKKIPSLINNYFAREKSGGNRFSTSVGGTLTGFHGDIIIWDDPINPQQSFSEIQLDIANRWIDETLPTRKTNKEVSVTIGIMQRLSREDPTGHILSKKKENTRHICMPGEIRGYKHMVKPKELVKYYKDGLFDVNRLSWKVLQELESDLGQYGYAGQIGQSPAPAGGGMFKTDFFQMTSEIFKEKDYLRSVRSWDKAGSQKSGTYTVGVRISRMKDGKFLIDDVKRGQWSSDVREKIIRQTAEVDGGKVDIVIEQEGGSGGKESAESTVRNLAGFHVEIKNPTGDKVARADPYSVQVNNGNVMLRTANWNKDFIDEHMLFPASTYKDQVDAAAQGFNYLTRKRNVRRIT